MIFQLKATKKTDFFKPVFMRLLLYFIFNEFIFFKKNNQNQ